MPIHDWAACRALSSAILLRATRAWRAYGHITKPQRCHGGIKASEFALARACGHQTPREELLEFFGSEWFDFLWSYSGGGTDKEKALEAIGVLEMIGVSEAIGVYEN